MKKILALVAILGATSVSAQTTHMFEFNADSVLKGFFSFDKSKTPGSGADNDTQLNLNLNYAYSLPTMPRLQLGGRMNYLKETSDAGDIENWGLAVGAIANMDTDLMNSFYASLYFGLDWNHEFGGGANDDESRTTTLSAGKRVSLDMWGLKHLTYTPEISLVNQNSTTGGDFEYQQSLQFRFLQFSVFF